uniref:CSON000381 protein n=1 Tax=Culicoides sonorensis TaxID=179676 RepID=A0A336MFL0_CULSO
MVKIIFMFFAFSILYSGYCVDSFVEKIEEHDHIRNITNSKNRKGKYLIYNSGGSIRMLCGFLVPTFIPKWQNINCLNAWSVGFNMPVKPSDWYDKFKGNINFQQYRTSKNLKYEKNNEKERFYKFLENKWGHNGNACLLRTICEVNEAPITHNGLLGEIVHTIFTPYDNEHISEKYKIAKRAGHLGANCMKIYPECSYENGFLEKYSVLGLLSPNK